MSVNPATPMNPQSQRGGPMSVNPATPNPQSQQPGSVLASTPATHQIELTNPLLRDPVILSKELIMKDLRIALKDLNAAAAVAIRTGQQSEEYTVALNNFMAVCDQIETNMTLVMETHKQINKFDKIFDKDNSKHANDPDHQMNMVQAYVNQTNNIMRAFERSIANVTGTMEKLRKRQTKGQWRRKTEAIKTEAMEE